jgi:hypothetical protein
MKVLAVIVVMVFATICFWLRSNSRRSKQGLIDLDRLRQDIFSSAGFSPEIFEADLKPHLDALESQFGKLGRGGG